MLRLLSAVGHRRRKVTGAGNLQIPGRGVKDPDEGGDPQLASEARNAVPCSTGSLPRPDPPGPVPLADEPAKSSQDGAWAPLAPPAADASATLPAL